MGFLDRFRRSVRAPGGEASSPQVDSRSEAIRAMPADDLSQLAGGADRIAVIDCETTGVFSSDRIVEIAIVTLDLNGRVVDSWDTLVQPHRDIGASHIHGLTAEMLADAPTFADVAGDVAIRLHGACLAAHNLRFDTRMVGGEFLRIGTEMAVLEGIDTLTATGVRLAAACDTHGIAIHGEHSALGDATATATLLKMVATYCNSGSPAVVPTGVVRSGHVLRRADTAPTAIPDPPYVARLAAALDLEGLEADMIAYLELVDRAVADLHLDAAERQELAELATGLGLNEAQLSLAHRRYINDLADAALADHVVTDQELDTLLRIATSLDVDTALVEQRTRSARKASVAVELTSGMSVTFTGDDPDRPRDELLARADDLGLTVGSNVTKRTELLVAYDTSSSSGKADKARRYGIPIVSTAQFGAAALGDELQAEAVAGAAMKVVTCPDCHATWTVEAKSGAHSRRRCDDCAGVRSPPRAAPPPREPMGPVIEELICSTCGRSWHRERLRGRKPVRCPDCVA